MISAPDCENPFKLIKETALVKRDTSGQALQPGAGIGHVPEEGESTGSMPWWFSGPEQACGFQRGLPSDSESLLKK